MPKRGEHIHKRKDGRWEGRYKNGVNNYGKTIYASVYGKTYTEVKSKLSAHKLKKISEIANDNIIKEWTLKEAILLWHEANKVKHKGSTEMKYENLIEKHILPELGKMKLSSITPVVLSNYMDKKLTNGRLDKQGGLSPSYVRSIMLIITEVLDYAVSEQMCKPIRNPIHKPSIQKKELKVLNESEQHKLEFELIKKMDSIRLGILLSLYTGLRIGEVCALKWNDIDLDRKIIHVRSTIVRVKNRNVEDSFVTMLVVDKPKTKSSLRDIPISSNLMPILTSMQPSIQSIYVVSNANKFMSPRTYEYRFHRILDLCGISSINYHILRHTFATRCIEAGVDVKSLSEILGHSNVSITLNTYVHSSIELKRTQLEKLSFILP